MTEETYGPERGAEVLAMDRAHVFHSWSAQRTLASGRHRSPSKASLKSAPISPAGSNFFHVARSASGKPSKRLRSRPR